MANPGLKDQVRRLLRELESDEPDRSPTLAELWSVYLEKNRNPSTRGGALCN